MEKAAEIVELNLQSEAKMILKIFMSNNTWKVDYEARKVVETDWRLLEIRTFYNDPTSWSSLCGLDLNSKCIRGVGASLLAKILNETQIDWLIITRYKIPEDGIVALSQALSGY